LKDAGERFNGAFERWRELSSNAVVQRNQARIIIDDPTAPKEKQKRAAAAEAEAKHEIALLLNQAGQTESDSYPYNFAPESGKDVAQPESCSRACYRCLLSYSNQTDHPKLDRFLIRDYLIAIRNSATSRTAKGRSYEDQYKWLMEKHDPRSNLEAEFLKELFEHKRRLPDRAQYRPEESVYCEADFYYERDGLKGIAIFYRWAEP
jgi:hypothetical protein